MRSCRYICIVLIALCSTAAVPAVLPCQLVLKYIHEKLPHYGALKHDSGFVYVDVDDDYIDKLVTYIQQEGFQEPPYFGGVHSVGAHITVIYPEEIKKYGIKNIDACGEMISFVPKGCQIVRTRRWKEIDEVYFIVVEAPQLDRIREKYDLPKRKTPFHITIGIKPTCHLCTCCSAL